MAYLNFYHQLDEFLDYRLCYQEIVCILLNMRLSSINIMLESFNSLKPISTFHLVPLAQTTESKYQLYDKLLNLYFPNFQNFLFESVSFILKFHLFLQNCSLQSNRKFPSITLNLFTMHSNYSNF